MVNTELWCIACRLLLSNTGRHDSFVKPHNGIWQTNDFNMLFEIALIEWYWSKRDVAGSRIGFIEVLLEAKISIKLKGILGSSFQPFLWVDGRWNVKSCIQFSVEEKDDLSRRLSSTTRVYRVLWRIGFLPIDVLVIMVGTSFSDPLCNFLFQLVSVFLDSW